MIVREHEESYTMIQQDHHARAAGEIMRNWKPENYLGPQLRESVEYAIDYHDYGWKEFDKQPFMDDKTNVPYNFFTFPNLPKIILYKHGIDEVAKADPYAALLCSEHYKRFLLNNTSDEAQAFVKYEEMRQQEIIQKDIISFSESLFLFHYGLLQLGDNISLYLCMNDPGVPKDQEHHFFRKGIPVAHALHAYMNPHINLRWKDERTVEMDDFPFSGSEILLTLRQKTVSKSDIASKGLIESYEASPFEDVNITLTSRT